MFYLISASAILIVLATLSIATLQFILLVDVVFGGHDFPTSRNGIKEVSKILVEFKKNTGIFYDLGSARGDFIVTLLKYSPSLQAFGVDNNRLRIFFAKGLSFLWRRPVHFLHGDIFSTNVSLADTVYIYLDISLMESLEKKLFEELKSGAMVITNTQSFPNWQPVKVYITSPKKPEYEKMFVYVKS